MDSSKDTKNTTLLRSQLFVPPLQYGILGQTLNESANTVKGFVCEDKPGWMSTTGEPCSDYSIVGSNCDDIGQDGTTAHDSCMVACNNCPAHIKLVKEEGGTYDRLPSPIEESTEPNFSSLLTDDNWKIGETKDISQNPEIPNKLDDIEQKLDELRKNIPKPFCTCSDVKSNLFGPSRCSNADLSDDFKWDPSGKFTYQSTSSIDSDVRYKVTCPGSYDYTKGVKSLNYKDKAKKDQKKTLVYNCTSQKWETKGHDRDDPFVTYKFPDGMIHCKDGPSPGPSPKLTCDETLKKIYDHGTHVCKRCMNPDKDRCEKDEEYSKFPAFSEKGKCGECLTLAYQNDYFNRRDVQEACPITGKVDEVLSKIRKKINEYCSKPDMGNTSSSLSAHSPSPSPSSSPSASHKPCSQGWLKRLFYDDKNCIATSPSPATDKKAITGTEVLIWVILSLLSVICGYLIYNAGGNIPIYLAINLGAVLIYVILRFEI
jgi:hypothetical protein